MTTFDRYLLFRFTHIFAVFFAATIGLFAVVDGFTNLDSFVQATKDGGTTALLLRMGQHYLFQSAMIFNLAGPTIIVISAMCVLALMLKTGEIHPVLAAGVPTYRLTLPLAFGVLALHGLLIVNQEWILPAIAPHLQGGHGETASDMQTVQPQYDPQWRIFVSARGAVPGEKKLNRPEFLLPVGSLARDAVKLSAESAIYLPGQNQEPSGWLVKQISPPFENLPLTELGRDVVIPQRNGQDVFISCALTFDQLCRQASNHRLVSTLDLFRRLRQPSASMLSRRALLVHVHDRVTQPILTMIGLYLVIPLIIRRDKMSAMQQVTNIALCMATLGIVFGLAMGSHFVGQAGVLTPEQAVWGPLIGGGSLAAWLTGVVRT